MLGIKGIKSSHIILGLVGVAIVFFIYKKAKGGVPAASGVPGSEMGTYIVPPLPENVTNIISMDELGAGPPGLVGPDVHPPGAYDVYSGAVGDVQYVPSVADIVAYRKQSEQPYEMGVTYQPY